MAIPELFRPTEDEALDYVTAPTAHERHLALLLFQDRIRAGLVNGPPSMEFCALLLEKRVAELCAGESDAPEEE